MELTTKKALLKMAGMYRDTDNSDELELFYRLSNQIAPDGSKLFNPLDIGNIDITLNEDLLPYKDVIINVLNNTSKVQEIFNEEKGKRGTKFVILCTEEMDKQREKEESNQAELTSAFSAKDTITTPSAKDVNSNSVYDSLKMDISRVLAQACIEMTIEDFAKKAFAPDSKVKKAITDDYVRYIKEIEKFFQLKDRDFSNAGYFVKDGVSAYDALKEKNIIDGEGRILDLPRLLESPLIKDTPDTFHSNAHNPIKLAEAPIIKKMRNSQNSQKLDPSLLKRAVERIIEKS